jgi:hypothetical protein
MFQQNNFFLQYPQHCLSAIQLYQPVLEWAQPATVVDLVPQLDVGIVEGQDLQEVRVMGPEVAVDLVVECHG